MTMSRRKRLLVFAPFAIAGIVIFTFIGGTAVQWLWNWLTPPLFGLPQITFWQAIGLLALCRILFGGLGVGGSSRSRMRHRMNEHWEGMTPEERERFRRGMRERWGFGPSTGESPESRA